MPPREGWKIGVYCILNRVNGKRYIGSSARSLGGRIRDHRIALVAGIHSNRHLQAAWNKYGGNNFSFSILERCKPSLCLIVEQKYIDRFNSADPAFGYNKCPKAGNSLGVKRTPEQLEKLSRIMKEVMARPEVRAAISEGTKGRIASPELRAKRSANATGRKSSVDTRLKMSTLMREGDKVRPACKGIRSDETRKLISQRASEISEETRQRRADAARAQWARIRSRNL